MHIAVIIEGHQKHNLPHFEARPLIPVWQSDAAFGGGCNRFFDCHGESDAKSGISRAINCIGNLQKPYLE